MPVCTCVCVALPARIDNAFGVAEATLLTGREMAQDGETWSDEHSKLCVRAYIHCLLSSFQTQISIPVSIGCHPRRSVVHVQRTLSHVLRMFMNSGDEDCD